MQLIALQRPSSPSQSAACPLALHSHRISTNYECRFSSAIQYAGKGKEQPNYLREIADFDSPADIGSFPELTMGIPVNNEPAVQ